MGNSESQQEEARTQNTTDEMRTCYYEILEVERSDSTTTDDIKKAYRRLALKFHPDKNHDNPQAAAEKFIQIQAAYEVLSDEQERAWYDSHREQILRGAEGEDIAQDKAVVGTTVADLMNYFDSSIFSRMNDSQKGFYTTMRTLFATLDREEEAAAREANENHTPLPSFGDSRSDPKEEVRRFYNVWLGFSTAKSFSWRDQYRYTDAPDRRVKRAMEKENKKLRDAARREFNDTVKSLVMFIRKRDPRYVKETVDEAKLQATLLAASQSQAARAKAAFQENLANFQTQEWMQAEDNPEEEDEDEESEVEEAFECVACKKVYKNEKQFEAHLKGKKHLKAAQALRRAMRDEDESLGMSDGLSTQGTDTPLTKEDPLPAEMFKIPVYKVEPDEEEEEVEMQAEEEEDVEEKNEARDENDEDQVDPGENEPETDEKTLKATETKDDQESSDAELQKDLDNLFLGSSRNKTGRSQQNSDGKPKLGAAKAKRQKKAEKLAALEAEGKAPPKPKKSRQPYDPAAAIAKARGETVTTGRKIKKK